MYWWIIDLSLDAWQVSGSIDVFCRAVKSQPCSELQGSRWHDQPDIWVSLWKGAPPPKAAALYQLCFFWLMIIFLHIQRTMLLPMHDVIKHQQQLLHSLSPYCVQNLISQEELLLCFSHVHVKTWISLWFISGCSVINLIVIWWSYLQVQKNRESNHFWQCSKLVKLWQWIFFASFQVTNKTNQGTYFLHRLHEKMHLFGKYNAHIVILHAFCHYFCWGIFLFRW